MKPVTAVSGYEYPAALLAMFAVIFVALGIAPLFRQDWLLENLLVFVALAILIVTRKRLRFSNVSYTLIFVLIGVHEYRSALHLFSGAVRQVGGRRHRRHTLRLAGTRSQSL